METPVGFEPDLFPGVDASHRATVERVVAEMRERVDETLSLQAMAEIAHLSPYHFARTFRRVTGIPPGAFMTALRLERAKRLLLTTDLSVGEICFEVGYESLSTFTTRFGQLVGLPPGRLRRLPEELALTPNPPPIPPAPPEASQGVAFRVYGPDLVAGASVYVGLFPSAIPQSRPAAGTILTAHGANGVHRLAPVPDGVYHLMAAALPRSEDPLKLLLPGDALRVGRGERLVSVRNGRAEGVVVGITLRLLQTTDPPVLIALAGGMLSEERRRDVGSPRRRAR